MTDKELQELRERNETRIKTFKESMGSKYLLHPENRIYRKVEEKNISLKIRA